MKRLKIAVTMGEPAGIGPEIIAKAVTHHRFDLIDFIIIGDKKFIPELNKNNITFHHIDFQTTIEYGKPHSHYADKILETIKLGCLMALHAKVDGLVTAPINKDTIHKMFPNFHGHTEYLSDVIFEDSGIKHRPIMMLSCSHLRAVPLTVHIPLSQVPMAITQHNIMEAVIIIDKYCKEKLKIERPRIQIAGLNPHASDNGIMGHEENEIIIPAILKLRDMGMTIPDVASADTMFYPEARQRYDIALCMYHDQALIPVKTLGFDEGVNVTLGLPIIRTSPDHGTALNIAGKNIANPNAMIAAIAEIQKVILDN